MIVKALALVSLVVATCAVGTSAAQPYPSATVKVIVPYGPGGGTDNIARALGERLSKKWNQPVVIENRPGAEAVVGTEAIARAPADGYTLGFVAPGHTLNPSTRAKLPYDTLKDFLPITMVAQTPFALAVSNETPARNAQELAALAKAQPGKLAYASADASSRLAGEMFNMLAGVQILNVPYKSIANAITDLVGGHVQVNYASLSSLLPHHAGGKVKLLAISGNERSPLAPDVPTLSETGWGAWDISAWYGLCVPAGTPRSVIEKVAKDVAEISAEPEYRAALLKLGAVPSTTTPEGFGKFIVEDIARTSKILKAAGIQPQ
jgi:tripartite-type tricarboxylate transporter receptor subunit TctC